MPKIGDEAPPVGGGGGSGDFIRHIRLLNDRESCVIRFLTEYGDFFWEKFHRIMERGSFRGMKVCAKSALGQTCEACETGGKGGKGDRPGTQFLGWAYEVHHDYTEKPSHVKDEDLEEVRVGKRTVLREEVNEPRLMRYSIMHFDPIKYQWDEEETLVDREFKWVRMGEKGSTRPTYILKPGAPSKLPKELRELAASLPDLEDVALGKVESFDNGDEEEKPKTRKVGRAKKAEPEDDDGEVDDPFGSGDEDDDDI